MLETKLVINSLISDAKHGSRMLCADIKDFFLASPMEENEYMKVKLRYFPEHIIGRYNLCDIATNDGYIYIQIKREMCKLKQAALLAYDYLCNTLPAWDMYQS